MSVVRGFVELDVPAVPGPERRIKDEPRTVVWREECDGIPVVAKLYRHRPVGAALRGRLAGCRAEREYTALACLVVAGVPCTEPISWSRGRDDEHGRWELLVTRERRGAASLRRVLESGERAPRDLALEPLFAAIGAMHGAGVFHGALWSSNVLVGAGAEADRFWLSDLARAVLLDRDLRGGALARGELSDFCYSLASLGAASAGFPLRLVGLRGDDERRFRARLEKYRPGKAVRQAVRARALLASALPGRVFRLKRGSGS